MTRPAVPLALALALPLMMRAQASAPAADPKAIARGLAEAGVVATAQWDAQGGGVPPLAVIAATEAGGGRIRFYGGDPLAILASHGDRDFAPAALYPACPSGCPLVTLWRAGFRQKVVVFMAERGEPRPVLEAEVLAAPELIADPERSEPLLVLKTVPAAGSAPGVRGVEAQLWRWREGRYEKFAAVPWAKRLAAVPGNSPAAPAPAPARRAPRRR